MAVPRLQRVSRRSRADGLRLRRIRDPGSPSPDDEPGQVLPFRRGEAEHGETTAGEEAQQVGMTMRCEHVRICTGLLIQGTGFKSLAAHYEGYRASDEPPNSYHGTELPLTGRYAEVRDPSDTSSGEGAVVWAGKLAGHAAGQ